MPGPLLAAKLFIPPPRRSLVPRPRLLAQLDRSLHRKLTLIAAPAGFGKTTLAAAWLAARDHPAAWFSPDEGDRDPARFLAYFVAALQNIDPTCGAQALELLRSAPAPPTEELLTLLLNDIAALPADAVLVLDDFHVIDDAAVDELLAFLLEHLPPRLHLLITTREDPNLPLARYRVRGQLNEVRAADLRFTLDEAAEFLNRAMGLQLAPPEIAALEKRTEGWIAGLQMAALSLQGREETAEFIADFTGSHHFVMDYLLDEVLERQPAEVRRFLLHTSILRRLSGPLCTAVTGQPHSREMLAALDRGNLLIVPLDDRREWYRYHHLFADVLQARALLEQPDLLPELHRRAAAWYEAHDLPAEAIHHALAAADWARAAALIERAWPGMNERFQEENWLGWARALPPEVIRARPVLCLNYGWALLNRGAPEEAEPYLRAAEAWQARAASADGRPPGMVVAAQDQYRLLPAALASARAFQAQTLGDVPATVQHGRRALDLYPPQNHLERGVAATIVGLAYWAGGDLEAAHTTFAQGLDDMQAAGNLLFALRGTYILADIRLAQGRLREAVATYERLLRLAAQQGSAVQRGTADLHLRLAELYFEQDDEPAARAQMARGAELGEQAQTPVWQYRLRLAQALSRRAQGDLEGALALLDAAERRYVRTPVPEVQPSHALRARLWIAQGRLEEAAAWAGARGLEPDGELSYLREFEHITLARLLLARGRRDGAAADIAAAARLLQRLHRAAEAGGRQGSVMEILLLQALAAQAGEDPAGALAALGQALALAAPQGYVRLFIDEGAPLAQLLAAAAAANVEPAYAARLLAARPSAPGGSAPPQPLPEPLSARELEILGLIAAGLSNRQISERLFLALSTVKGHNGRIFAKLAVRRRTEAVARARELGLL